MSINNQNLGPDQDLDQTPVQKDEQTANTKKFSLATKPIIGFVTTAVLAACGPTPTQSTSLAPNTTPAASAAATETANNSSNVEVPQEILDKIKAAKEGANTLAVMMEGSESHKFWEAPQGNILVVTSGNQVFMRIPYTNESNLNNGLNNTTIVAQDLGLEEVVAKSDSTPKTAEGKALATELASRAIKEEKSTLNDANNNVYYIVTSKEAFNGTAEVPLNFAVNSLGRDRNDDKKLSADELVVTNMKFTQTVTKTPSTNPTVYLSYSSTTNDTISIEGADGTLYRVALKKGDNKVTLPAQLTQTGNFYVNPPQDVAFNGNGEAVYPNKENRANVVVLNKAGEQMAFLSELARDTAKK